MKKKILMSTALLSIVISVAADDAFYYFDGVRIPLYEDVSRLVMTTGRNVSANISSFDGFSVVKCMSDDISNVTVLASPVVSDGEARMRSAALSDSASGIWPCYKNDDGLELAPTGYLFVKLKTANDCNMLEQTASAYGCFVVEQDPFMPLWYSLHVSTDAPRNPVELANALYETGKFASAAPEFAYDPLEISYDPDVLGQWGLYNSLYEGIDISASEAWNYSTGKGINIAIVDQGIELTHDDLIDNLSPLSYDANLAASPSHVYNTSSIGHGTHCAGIAAAVRNNDIMITGVAPDATLMSVSCKFNGTNPTQQLAYGINWAWQNGADVISCSWHCPVNEYVQAALDLAITKGRGGRGCIIVKSAGNSGGAITFPGSYREEIIAVANITKTGIRAGDSSHGSNLLVCAPGTDILSTMIGNTTSEKSGTSMACPHVSGVAALILERNPDLTADQVREILGRSTDKIGDVPYSTVKKYGTWNEYYGYGLINAYKAVINTPEPDN